MYKEVCVFFLHSSSKEIKMYQSKQGGNHTINCISLSNAEQLLHIAQNQEVFSVVNANVRLN